MGSFLLTYLSGLLRSFVVQLGVSEEIYSPVRKFSDLYLILPSHIEAIFIPLYTWLNGILLLVGSVEGCTCTILSSNRCSFCSMNLLNWNLALMNFFILQKSILSKSPSTYVMSKKDFCLVKLSNQLGSQVRLGYDICILIPLIGFAWMVSLVHLGNML